LKFLSSYGFIVYALKKSVQFIVADSVRILMKLIPQRYAWPEKGKEETLRLFLWLFS